jgi:hypothetical protein
MMDASHGRFSENGCGGCGCYGCCGCDVDAEAYDDASGCVLCFFAFFFEHRPEAHPVVRRMHCLYFSWSMQWAGGCSFVLPFSSSDGLVLFSSL